jgi:hypothetical protein
MSEQTFNELIKIIHYKLNVFFKVYLPHRFNVFINLISTKNRMVHGAMFYKCNRCGKKWRMYLETGVEGKDKLMPCPFIITCPCGSFAKHTDWQNDLYFPHPFPLEKNMSFFMLDRRGLKKKNPHAHGLPIIRKHK